MVGSSSRFSISKNNGWIDEIGARKFHMQPAFLEMELPGRLRLEGDGQDL
jgi:hypothetical protein